MYGACKLESNVNSILSNDTGAVCGRTVAGGTVYGACKFESNMNPVLSTILLRVRHASGAGLDTKT